MRFWWNHPVLFAALAGASLGLVIAATFLFIDPLSPMSSQFLYFLFPTSILGIGFNDGSLSFSIFLAIVEIGGNALLYGFALSAPVAAVVLIRRQFGRIEKPQSIIGK